MKRTFVKRPVLASEVDDYEGMSFNEWYYSDEGQDDGVLFVETLEKLVRNQYPVADFFEEPSIQGMSGGDFLRITLDDGSVYGFRFGWFDEQSCIYDCGPELAAELYFDKIKRGIDSGSALRR